MIWIYAVCKGRVYKGSAGQGLSVFSSCCSNVFFVKTYNFPIFSVRDEIFNSFPANANLCYLLITFANSLDPGQARQNVGPDLDPNCLTL